MFESSIPKSSSGNFHCNNSTGGESEAVCVMRKGGAEGRSLFRILRFV